MRPLLAEITATFPRSHFAAILGPSGCGKSTLLKVITGIAHGTEEGHIYWDGRDLIHHDFSPSEIGYVPQFSIAHEVLTVRECVSYSIKLRVRGMGGDALEEAMARILEEVNMTEFADRFVRVLSGGRKAPPRPRDGTGEQARHAPLRRGDERIGPSVRGCRLSCSFGVCRGQTGGQFSPSPTV